MGPFSGFIKIRKQSFCLKHFFLLGSVVEMFGVHFILIPVHRDRSHRALGVVDTRNQTVQYLDSLGNGFPQFTEFMQLYYHDEWLDKEGSLLPPPEYTA